MTYILLIILIGVAIYYASSWQSTSNKANQSNKSGGNPYANDGQGSYGTNQDTGPYAQQNHSASNSPKGTNYTKWVAGGLGWAFGGPIGGLLGYMFGSMVGGSAPSGGIGTGQTRAGDFNVSLLILSAAVMRADGKVTRNELNYVKAFISNNFGAARAPEYVSVLGELIKKDFNLYEVSTQIKQHMDYSSKLMLVQFLFGIASADGKFHENEIGVINTIASSLGLSNSDYESIKAMFIKDANSAYKILEISKDATDDEVKKAYRELAKKYHPDKVSHLGDDVKKAAETKISEINAAYDAIKEERGIK